MILLLFTLDDLRCSLHISSVERAYPAVAVTPLPDAPHIVLGIVNVRGVIQPVINIRRRFHLPERNIQPNHHLIVAHTSKRSVAFLVDSVVGVIDCPEQQIIAADTILPNMEYVEGVCKLKEGMVLIHDLDRFISSDEDAALSHALEHI